MCILILLFIFKYRIYIKHISIAKPSLVSSKLWHIFTMGELP